MSDAANKILRVIFGLVSGFLGGTVVGLCLLILVWIVCSADGGSFNGKPKHEWVETLANDSPAVIKILAPLAGSVIGVIWALRRNRRDETKNPGSSP